MRFVMAISLIAAGALVAFAQHEYTQSEVEAGRQQYTNNCARCHGPDGDEIANADIGRGKFRRASSDEELVRLIQNGIPETKMTGFNNMSEPNAQTIVAYLRAMASTAATVASMPAGDPGRGKGVFEGKGSCANCHRIGDKGSRTGPDLSQIGSQRRAVELHRSLVEPDAEITPANRLFRVITKEGTTTTGRLLNQDTFTVQLIDVRDEKLKSFAKSNLREYAFVTTSSMPSYKDKLNTQELADVIAYLASLKGQ